MPQAREVGSALYRLDVEHAVAGKGEILRLTESVQGDIETARLLWR